jgi:hypothetical protein
MRAFNEGATARTALPPSLPPLPPFTPLLALLICACMPLTSDASRPAAAAAGFFGGGPGTHSGSAGGGWTTLVVVAALLLGVPVAAVILYALWQHLSERFWRWHPAVREPLLGGVLSPATARPLASAAAAEERSHVSLHAVEEHFSQRVRLATAAEERSAAAARRGRPGPAARGPRAEPNLPSPPMPGAGVGGGGSPPPAGEEPKASAQHEKSTEPPAAGAEPPAAAERMEGVAPGSGSGGGGFSSLPGADSAIPPPSAPFSF